MAKENAFKESELAAEETQIMSVVMDEVAVLHEHLYPGNITDTHETYHISCDVGRNFEITKQGESLIDGNQAFYLTGT